ncbi:MAG: hypothetical protein Q8N18_03530 [Opitutaceae bacterium]|nr:hypothetical protein [Opitutaceae bacterium]
MKNTLLAASRACAVLVVFGPWCLRAADGDKIPKTERRELRRATDGDFVEPKKESKKDGKPAVSDQQARTLDRLRERLEITDDEEWAIVAERLARVEEARRAAGGPVASPAMDRGKKPDRKDAGGGERDALRAAVADRLPEAEVRSRLSRLAEVQRQHAAKLTRAQEELRAVLTVRQEAITVVLGILPP